MKRLTRLLTALLSAGSLCLPLAASAEAEDIYAVQFSADGRHLVTGGSGGHSMEYDENYSGGIKLWDVDTGELIKSFGQQVHLYGIFGQEYGRVGKRRWDIHSFKDIVVNGTYPDGKILLLPSSLGHIQGRQEVTLPEFFGASVDFSGNHMDRIRLSAAPATEKARRCGEHAYEYIGPVVASDNGRYAAVAVNTCKAQTDRPVPIAQYDSTVHVVDLNTLKVVRSLENVDSGLYALGIANDGGRLAFVGRDHFAVVDVASGKRKLVETYPDAVFQVPRQFSTLYFNQDATKLVSLHYILDIESGQEKALEWSEDSAVSKGRTASVKVAPNLDYFVLVKPKRSFIVFGDDGLPRSYGKADRVVQVDVRTGEERELKVTDSRTEGKKCVTDISPDSRRIAVACAGGLLKVFDAGSGKLVWEQQAIGYRKDGLDEALIRVQARPLPFLYSMAD